jgi:hypothetical protein
MPLGALEELENWGTNANCYAYAFNCLAPARGAIGGAVPGGLIGNPANGGPNHAQDCVARALADGNGAVVQAIGNPTNPPVSNANTYLVALIAHQTGFHWLRRDTLLDRWSWKDGNTGSVKYNILHIPQNRYVYIKSRNLVDDLAGNLADLLVVNRGDYGPWAYANMQFVSFFHVNNGGTAVAGR